MGLIQQELKLSQKKMFKTVKFKGKDIVKISLDNVAIAEAMIKNDSDYIVMYDTSVEKSGAYWLAELKKVYETEKSGGQTKEDIKKIIKNAVEALDKENSTHLNSDGVGREQITDRIYSVYEKGKLFELLQKPGKEYELFHFIEEKTAPNPKDKNKHARVNTSFASKFCHYAAFFIFEGKKEQDNYSIWDSVLRNTIPIYLDYYKIDFKYNSKSKDYVEYQEVIDLIREKAKKDTGDEISRNGFDHLLWYYYKGRMDLVKELKN